MHARVLRKEESSHFHSVAHRSYRKKHNNAEPKKQYPDLMTQPWRKANERTVRIAGNNNGHTVDREVIQHDHIATTRLITSLACDLVVTL
jgi:hypothetical protein